MQMLGSPQHEHLLLQVLAQLQAAALVHLHPWL
jgi:hypothetical protein